LEYRNLEKFLIGMNCLSLEKFTSFGRTCQTMIPVLGNASLSRGPNLPTGQECFGKIERQSQMMYIALGVGTEFHPEFIPAFKE